MTDDLYRTRLTEAMEPFAREHPTVWGSADDGPFDADALRDHDQRGFTILPDFIAPEEVKTYQAELNRLTSDQSLRSDERVVTEKASGRSEERRVGRHGRSARCADRGARSGERAG